MEKKGHFLFVVLLALLAFSATAQDNTVFIEKDHNPELKVTVTGYFGISLMTTYTGFVRYGYIQIKSTGEQLTTWLTRDQFLQQASGQVFSKANPGKKNLLEEKGIKKESFENLWKLRYSEYPYDGSQELGWAGLPYAPSEGQWSFLSRNYHFTKMDQFLYGEDMWRLVKDSQDPDWQRQYSSLK